MSWTARRGKWAAQIKHGGRSHWLGYFATEDAAGAAYDQAKSRLHGEFAPPPTTERTGPMTYRESIDAVDHVVMREAGVSVHDLADYNFRDAYADEMDPADAAAEILERERVAVMRIAQYSRQARTIGATTFLRSCVITLDRADGIMLRDAYRCARRNGCPASVARDLTFTALFSAHLSNCVGQLGFVAGAWERVAA